MEDQTKNEIGTNPPKEIFSGAGMRNGNSLGTERKREAEKPIRTGFGKIPTRKPKASMSSSGKDLQQKT
jgi:hypothetical protein